MLVYGLFLVCISLLGAALIRSAEDASIGGGFLLGLVAMLGLPWSAAVFLGQDGLHGGGGAAILYASLAILNAALLTGLAGAVGRRRNRGERGRGRLSTR